MSDAVAVALPHAVQTPGTDEKVLLAFTIGPVKEFISAARRTQDLFAASKLLSLIMYNACEAAGGQAHVVDPVYPQHPDWQAGNVPPIPDLFIAQYSTREEARAYAYQASTAARATWDAVAAAVKRDLDRWVRSLPQETTTGWDALWQQQVDNYLEIYWAILPGVQPDERYGLSLSRVRAALEARERLRDFSPNPQPGYKCTVYGGLSCLGPWQDDHQSFPALRTFWSGLADHVSRLTSPDALYISLRPSGRERLSAIASIKRFGPISYETNGTRPLHLAAPSTSSIAAGTYKAALLKTLAGGDVAAQAVASALKAYGTALREIKDAERELRTYAYNDQVSPYLHSLADTAADKSAADVVLRYDGDLFFDETLVARRLFDDYGLKVKEGPAQPSYAAGQPLIDISKALRGARAALKKLLHETSRLGIKPPTPYFAVLAMDGDNVGKRLRALSEADEHRTLSRSLAGFATDAVQLIIEHDRPGKVVYAGGDDVVALLPIEDVLVTARELQGHYSARVVVPTNVQQRRAGRRLPSRHSPRVLQARRRRSERPTASVGIAIAHHLTPLGTVLGHAFAAQDDAKDEYGRNAVSVRALKRSGAPILVGLHNYPGHEDLTGAVRELQNLLEADRLSPRFAYTFARSVDAFPDGREAMLASYLSLLLKRQGSWAEPREPRLLGLRLARFASRLTNTNLAAIGAAIPTTGGLFSGSERLANWLLLVAFLARGGAE